MMSDSVKSLYFVSKELLKWHKIPFTTYYLKKNLKNDPDFPSFLALSNLLREYNIDNEAIKIPKSDIGKLPLPAIAHTLGSDKSKSGEFILITSIKNNTITYKSINGIKTEKTDVFFLKASGAFIVAEITDRTKEIDYTKNRLNDVLLKLKIPFIIASLFIFIIGGIAYLINAGITLSLVGLLTLYFIGVVVSGILVFYEFNKSSTLFNRLCSKGDKGCSSILESPAATLVGMVKWSDLGLLYFSGCFFTLLLGIILNVNTLNFLFFLHVVPIIYSFYSIYYQFVIAKKYCILCLTIQLISWFILALYLANPVVPANQSGYKSIVLFLTSFSLPTSIYLIIRPWIISFFQYDRTLATLNKLKYNYDVFKALALRSTESINFADDVKRIVIGDPNANKEVIIVTNPFCNPCAKAHLEIKKLLEEYDGEFKVTIIFALNPHHNEERNEVSKHLMAVYFSMGQAAADEALSDWYSSKDKNYNVWKDKYPCDLSMPEVTKTYSAQRQWNIETIVSFTPSIFYNGLQMGLEYSVDDLKYFIRNF